MSTTFTQEQATEICEDFEDLIDTELIIDTVPCFIDDVTMVPFEEAGKALFMQVYKDTGDTVKALATYTGNEYDVFIIASNTADPKDIITQDIHSYIANNGVGYNFPE